MDDKLALRISQAGMRFIAQMTIYNSADFERLQTFIVEGYQADLLQHSDAHERVGALREQYERFGKMRVQQVIGTGKHHVIVLVVAQKSESYFLNELKVEEDYPHHVIEYNITPMV